MGFNNFGPGPRAALITALITSRQHPLCKLVRALRAPKGRREHGLFAVEGSNAVAAALRARWPLRQLLLSPNGVEAWREAARAGGVALQVVAAEIMEYLSEAQTAPDVIALAEMPTAGFGTWGLEAELFLKPETPNPEPQTLYVLLDGISDPGNVGTLLRSADAAGASGVAITPSSADPFGPKAVRAAAGSLFHLPPAISAIDELTRLLHERRIPLIAACAHDGDDCFSFQWPRRCALALGHETRGVSSALQTSAVARVTIPMFGRAESLNVAAAGAVLLYAWRAAMRASAPRETSDAGIIAG